MNRQNILRKDLILVGSLSLIFFMLFLGETRMLSIPDEGRYVGIAVEMLRTGDFVIPRLNGVQYLYKPPLFYWLNTLSIMAFDNIVWASRLVPALLSWITVLITFAFARRFYGRRVSFASAGFLSLSFIWYIGGHSVNLDLAVASFTAWTLFLYMLGFVEVNKTRRNMYLYAMYISASLAVLTKGFMGIVLPGAVFFLHIAFTNNWKMLFKLNIPTGILLFTIIIAPWHILMNNANSEWFDFYIIREHFLRFFTTVHHRYAPWWYFIPFLAVGVIPFGAFAVQPLLHIKDAWAQRTTNGGLELFLLIWVGFIFFFFSMSSSKLPLYVLPIIPAMAVLSGRFMIEFIDGKHQSSVKFSSFVYMLFAGGIGVIFLVFQSFPDLVPETESKNLASDLETMGLYLWVFVAGLISHSVISWIAVITGENKHAIILAGVLYIPTALSINFIMQETNDKSSAPLINVLKQNHNGEEIVLTRFVEDIPPYLNETVSVINYNGESDYFTHYEDLSNRYYDLAEFKRRWNSDKKIFLILNNKDKKMLSGLDYKVLYEDSLYSLIGK